MTILGRRLRGPGWISACGSFAACLSRPACCRLMCYWSLDMFVVSYDVEGNGSIVIKSQRHLDTELAKNNSNTCILQSMRKPVAGSVTASPDFWATSRHRSFNNDAVARNPVSHQCTIPYRLVALCLLRGIVCRLSLHSSPQCGSSPPFGHSPSLPLSTSSCSWTLHWDILTLGAITLLRAVSRSAKPSLGGN